MTIIDKKYAVVDGKIVNRTTGKPIPDDEPLVLFRSQDVHLPWLLNEYALKCKDENHKQVAWESMEEVERWQEDNHDKVKEPDTGPLAGG